MRTCARRGSSRRRPSAGKARPRSHQDIDATPRLTRRGGWQRVFSHRPVSIGYAPGTGDLQDAIAFHVAQGAACCLDAYTGMRRGLAQRHATPRRCQLLHGPQQGQMHLAPQPATWPPLGLVPGLIHASILRPAGALQCMRMYPPAAASHGTKGSPFALASGSVRGRPTKCRRQQGRRNKGE